MKFLWIFTTAIAIFFAYHTYTHTRIRYKDLESVMQQNLAMEKAVKVTHFYTEKQWHRIAIEVEKVGNLPKEVAIMKITNTIRNYADSLSQIIKEQRKNWNTENLTNTLTQTPQFIQQSNSFNHTFPAWVATQDTVLKDLAEPIKLYYSNKSFAPFVHYTNLHHQNVLERLRTKAVDKMVSRGLGSCVVIIFDKIIAMASSKKYFLSSGEVYQAQMFMTIGQLETVDYPINCQMQISEGHIRTNLEGNVGEIEIPNVKAQNYNSEGKATKTLTGKITIKKADGNDTTFTLSTSYTVKKLVRF